MPRQHREITPDDLPVRPQPSIDISEGMGSKQPEKIKLVDRPISAEYADELAFMEEQVLIRLEKPQSESDQPKSVLAYPFSVNGRTEWIPTDKPWSIKRKFLEVILRAQPYRVATEHFNPGEKDEKNLMHRYASRRFSISILNDPNPRGPEWHRRVCLEA